MKATVTDLRYWMNDVLKALDRHEEVSIFYRGKTIGVLTARRPRKKSRMTEHPFFNMSREKGSVAARMEKLRGSERFSVAGSPKRSGSHG